MTPSRVLVLSAGTGATNNLMRGLGADGAELIGCHADRFTLKKSTAARNYLVPPAGDARFAAALLAIVAKEQIDLVVPGNDDDVRVLAGLRAPLGARLFLPSDEVIATCQDKFRLTTTLRARGVPMARAAVVTGLDDIERIFADLGGGRLWCRIRNGSGSRGAIPVARPAQARAWIEYWHEMRGVPVDAFTLSELLPGRDFAAQGLWREGTLVLLKLCERLSYFGGGSQPSGMSSTPALARMAREPHAAAVCAAAIAALDPAASGVFSIDLKCDAGGRPCVTEINAGRFCMITPFFDATGPHNMAATYVRLARGERVTLDEPYEAGEEAYLVRDLDTLPGIFTADELFDGIDDLHAEGG